ncbi:MAG TPA: 2,3-diaminopropionate biosynthesis protein SbnB, partial [Thermoanaerobaculia bacterium]|nr:2,3-diaminopropionate biosynthesis protein SbnB [Thermoanaerobaculia bacterium]
ILRYLRHGFRLDGEVVLFDNGPEGGARFAAVVERLFGLRVGLASSAAQALAGADVLSLATTAAKPHLDSLERLRPGATVLHVSLRDLAPEVILGSDNVVDDRDHVLRAETSLHLAEQAVGNRAFIRASLGELLLGRQPVRPEPERLTVFSPFGLGVLDLAVADWVYRCAEQAGLGRTVEDFQPRPWWEVEA